MSEFVSYLIEVFEPFGRVQSRKMFGGYGIFFDGIMIGLVANDELYLKVDAHSRPRFVAQDLPAFEYTSKKGTAKMSYHLAPEEIFEDPDSAVEWARIAHDAALRAAKKSR